jgi:ribulose-5-phosphate 4-epimerase/fuculose-1-phosphate aldolase
VTATFESTQTQDQAGQVFVSEVGGVQLTPKQNVALLHRMLWDEGYNDRIAGHISARLPDGNLLCTPYGLTWEEIRASDILTIDRAGNRIEGKWEVPLPITIHVVAHEMRPDIHIAIHHHPAWATAWSAARRLPPVYDQLAGFGGAGLVLYDEYLGAVDDRDIARRNVAAMGEATVALLANHGVFVLAGNVVQAHLRSTVVEHRCELAARVEQIGGGTAIDEKVVDEVGSRTVDGWPDFYDAMVRRQIRKDPSVLD